MTFVIAEAGVNHNGKLELAHKLIDAAHMSGADAVKFQTFKSERLEPPGSRRDMLQALELSQADFVTLKKYCGSRIEFMSTPFDVESLDFLCDVLDVKRIKISSGCIGDANLLRAAEESGLPIILSTGMCDQEDVSKALSRLKYAKHVTLLHCTSAYPTPYEDVNLRAIQSLASAFGCPVGLSDHTLGMSVPIAAVALGAVAIEKHITLDRSMAGPDHTASMMPFDFKRMVFGIRDIEKALGDGIKRKMPSESQTVEIVKERRAWAA